MSDVSPAALARLPDWEDRLHALVSERNDMGFLWGERDCALWGADVVNALTGVDHGAAFRGRYDDAAGAALALREHGAGTITRTFDRHLPRRPLAMLRRGDLVAMGNGTRAVIGVVFGSDALFVGDVALERRARALWSRGWGVG